MVALGAACLLALAQDEAGPGARTVHVHHAAYFQRVKPSRQGLIREARYGETIEVIGVEGSYSKVKLPEGKVGYVSSKALIFHEKFAPAPADEAEMMNLKAQGYEAGRFDPETEKEYRAREGGAIDAAYKRVDALEARRAHRWPSRGHLERDLSDFRKGGGLGEFASVR